MNFTQTQKEVLDGCLLGDGSLIIPKNGKNAYFQYLSSSKEHVEVVHKHFKVFCNYSDVKRREIYDKRTDKTYVHYLFKTKALPLFTKEYKRWYKPLKIVPKDVLITDISCLYWYIGDGELESNYGYIKLHTNSFSKEDCEYLCKKMGFLSKLLHKESNQYLVTIPRREVSNFLNYIGDCPVNDYIHKWKEVPYKNKNIEKNGITYHTNKYPDIAKDWKKGSFTIYGLSKKYSVDVTAIKNYFNKNNIKWSPKKTNKEILQLNLKGDLVKEWTSGQEIVDVLGFCASAISACCRGKRKTHKNYRWKFKKDEKQFRNTHEGEL